MKYNIIATGSKGNCIIVEDIFMLDCGLAYSKIKSYLKGIRLVFISHRHADHLNKSTVRRVAYEYPNIKFIVGEQLVRTMTDYVSPRNIITIPPSKWYDIGLCKVKLEYLVHDVANYCLKLEYKGKKLLYATDTNDMSYISAKDYNLYLVEADYETDEEIEARIVEAKKEGKFTYLDRVRDTHLSQLKALNWLDKNKGENSEYCFIHQHEGSYDE